VVYFAYGSNMLRERLFERIGNAGELGTARLPGYRLVFHKRGDDGSGKCTVVGNHAGHEVWGVVFELNAPQKATLDQYEGRGYSVEKVVLSHNDTPLEAFTYISRQRWLDPSAQPYSWYKGLVLVGAIQAGLPRPHVARIESVSAIEDNDHDRANANKGLIRRSED